MGVSLAVSWFVLCCSIIELKAVPIETGMESPDLVMVAKTNGSIEEFELHITENGTKFDEKIYIDMENDIEYFQVPQHNGLSETETLFDFKTNITVSRQKKDRVCLVSPLPENLPRPNVLSRGLQRLSKAHRSHKVVKTSLEWALGPKIDKSTLTKEVQSFCGRFQVYRLLPYNREPVSFGKSGRGKRQSSGTLVSNPLCKPKKPNCLPNEWLYSCAVSARKCVYYVTCRTKTQGRRQDLVCESLAKHLYNSIICCKPSCPKN